MRRGWCQQGNTGSKVRLRNFQDRYRGSSKKSGQAIAEAILEHVLWYFIRPANRPQILLLDGAEKFDLDNIYDDLMHQNSCEDTVQIKDKEFTFIHVKTKPKSGMQHSAAYCADARLVQVERIDNLVQGLHSSIEDEHGKYLYQCYVSSPVLDEWARPERTGFDLEKSINGIFGDSEISFDDIRSAIAEKTTEFLADDLASSQARTEERVRSFIANRAPRYRPIFSDKTPSQLNVSADVSDKELEIALHRQLAELETDLISDGHDLLSQDFTALGDEYSELLKEYLSRAEKMKMSDLAGYVSHRRVILDLLRKAIARDEEGNYAREDLIHNLIMPMRTESDQSSQSSNLWLIDERLAFHDYLASDTSLAANRMTGARGGKEPDIAGMKVLDAPFLVSERREPPLASIVVVEIKRPMLAKAKAGEIDDPVEQAIGYLNRIRKGKMQTASGRPIPSSFDSPGYCYVIADLTEKMEERCSVHHDFRATEDGLGFFGFKENAKAYVEVISYDRLLLMATQRNQSFFDMLGLPSV